MTIMRLDQGLRMSQAVVHGETVYLAGQVGSPGTSIATQTTEILAAIDALLSLAGSSKDHLLMTTIWLADMADFDEMNLVWDDWIAGHPAPARATGEARLGAPGYKIEIIVVAARR